MSHYNDFQFHIALHETATETEIKLNMLARSAVFFYAYMPSFIMQLCYVNGKLIIFRKSGKM